MKHLLVPVDGSAIAEQVFPYAQLLARAWDAEIRLLRVDGHAEHDYIMARYGATRHATATADGELSRYQRVIDENADTANRYLANASQALQAMGVAVAAEVRFGEPAEEIVEAAAAVPNTCIAMTTHGYGGLQRWTLGSVTDRVIHAASTPIFVVRATKTPPAQQPPFRRILVPLDGSRFSEQALPVALELAERTQAEITLLRVRIPLIETYPYHAITIAYQQEIDTWTQRQLDEVAEPLRQRFPAVRSLIRMGYPAEEILDVAHEWRSDLIVMATHGYSGLRRWAVGSVADKLVHAATTPLLLVRPQEHEQ